MSVNKAILVGHLGKDAELRHTQAGKSVCNFSLATTERWVDGDGEKQEKTEWHSVVAWGKLAEICGEHLSKGRMVYVEGRLQTRSYDDKQGAKHYKTEVVAERVKFLGGNRERREDSTQDETPNDDDSF